MNLLYLLKLVALGLSTLILAPVVVGLAGIDGRRAYRICQLWVRFNLLAFGLRVRVRRLSALDPETPYVFMSNHQSQLDPLAVVAALPEFQLRWVAKRELARVPVFGWALRRAGHIIIDRSDPMQAIHYLRAARGAMRQGASIIIFPEGTRATGDGGLLPFKQGGFLLALETGMPIVPLVVSGSRPRLPKGDWRVRGGELEVVVGPPMSTVGEERGALVGRVRDFMVGCLDGPTEPPRIQEAI